MKITTMTDWNRLSAVRPAAPSGEDDMMGSPLPRSGGPFNFPASSYAPGIRDSKFNPSDFVSPSKEGEVSMEFSPFSTKKNTQNIRTECVNILRSQSTPVEDLHEKRIISCSAPEGQENLIDNKNSPSKHLILELFSSPEEPQTVSKSTEVFPVDSKSEQTSAIDKLLLGETSEQTRSQLFGNLSSRSKLFSCPESDDNIGLQPGDIFASSPGSPCSPDTPVLNLFNADLEDFHEDKATDENGIENRSGSDSSRLRRCHSLEIRKNLFDLSNTPPNSFIRSKSRRSLFKRPLDIQIKEKNFSKRLRDGTIIKGENEKDCEEGTDVKSLLCSTPSNTRLSACDDDSTPTRTDNRSSSDEDKTPLSRSTSCGGRVSPILSKESTAANILHLKNRKISEKDQERIKTAVDTLQSGELVADGSRVYCLPLISGKHQDLKNIHHQTMADLINGKYERAYDKVTVIDCRYPYEYKGGHIRGALNIYTEKEMSDFLHAEIEKTSQQRGIHIIVFHCEFSSQRGPGLLRHLRSCDRQINLMDYPRLVFPEIYCLFGGYKEFYNNHPELCDPSAYMTMADENMCKAYLHFKQRAKTWSADSRR